MVDKLHHLADIQSMALNIKNSEVERLASELSNITGESKTEAIRKALSERKARLAEGDTVEGRREKLLRFLEREIWPKIPSRIRGKRLSKRERERILGYGPRGV